MSSTQIASCQWMFDSHLAVWIVRTGEAFWESGDEESSFFLLGLASWRHLEGVERASNSTSPADKLILVLLVPRQEAAHKLDAAMANMLFFHFLDQLNSEWLADAAKTLSIFATAQLMKILSGHSGIQRSEDNKVEWELSEEEDFSGYGTWNRTQSSKGQEKIWGERTESGFRGSWKREGQSLDQSY